MRLHRFFKQIFCKHYYTTVAYRQERFINCFGYIYIIKHYRYRCLLCGKEKTETRVGD